jgi:hypothetical protein
MRLILTSRVHGAHEVLLDDEDYEKFNGWTIYLIRTPAIGGRLYAMAYAKGNKRGTCGLHRLITRADKTQLVDHIDRNTLDNRKLNLRLVGAFENTHNRGKHRGASCPYYGVSFDSARNVWVAQVSIRGSRKYLGRFRIAQDAAKAYDGYVRSTGIIKPINFIENIK